MPGYHNIDETFFLPDQEFFVQTLDYIETIYHEHSFFEIFYVLSGEIQHTVNDRTERLVSGDIVFLRPGDAHKFENKHSDDFIHTDILVKNNLFQKAVAALDSPLLRDFLLASEPYRLHLNSHELSFLEEEIRTIESSGKSNLSALTFSFVCNLLCLIIKKVSPAPNNTLPLWLRQLISLLNASSSFTKTKKELYDMLDSLSYNRSYISRAFKKYMSCTMTNYINDLGFTSAYSLLRSTDRTIGDIIASVGISNKTYFYKEFYKRYHATPAQIKAKHESQQN